MTMRCDLRPFRTERSDLSGGERRASLLPRLRALVPTTLLVVGMVGVPAMGASAQVGLADTVRVRATAGPRMRGVVTSAGVDSLTLRSDRGEDVRLRLDSLRSVEVLRGRKTLGWRAVRRGAAFGAIAGLVLAPLAKASDDRANEGNAGQGFDPLPHNLAFYEVATGTLGALVGTIVGAAASSLKVERWERVPAATAKAGP
jgi:hypothetical protein